MKQQDTFAAENAFFVIDSDHLSGVRTRLYGFATENEGIIENENLSDGPAGGLSGGGAYVFVERNAQTITIRQDFNGSFGLYLYRSGSWFAISNSFSALAEHLSGKHPMTVDADYFRALLPMRLCSYSYSYTPISEIRILPKNVTVVLQADTGDLSIRRVDYDEDRYSLDQEESLQIIDDWFLRWARLVRGIKEHGGLLGASLSGGFDSRLAFVTVLCSGLDLNTVSIDSNDDDFHTHREDFQIASQIAEHYGFSLNDFRPVYGKVLCPDLEEILRVSAGNQMLFHKEMYYKYWKFTDRRYRITGNGGETLRAFSTASAKEFEEQNVRRAQRRYSPETAEEVVASVRKIFRESAESIIRDRNLKDPDPMLMANYFQRELESRHHCARAIVDDWVAGFYTLPPLMDPSLCRIRIQTPDCPDRNLLYSVMYLRFAPELTEFPFQGDRILEPRTLEKAREINRAHPADPKMLEEAMTSSGSVSVLTKDPYVSGTMIGKPGVPFSLPDECLQKIFLSDRFGAYITRFCNPELYTFARAQQAKASYYPMRECYPLLALATVSNLTDHDPANPVDAARFLLSFLETE